MSIALCLIEELGPHLDLNLSMCKLFSRKGNTLFSSTVKTSALHNLAPTRRTVPDSYYKYECAVQAVDLHAFLCLWAIVVN